MVLERFYFPFSRKGNNAGIRVHEIAEIYLGQGQDLGRISPQGDVKLPTCHKDLGQGGLSVALYDVGHTLAQRPGRVHHRIRPNANAGILGHRLDDEWEEHVSS